MALSNIRREPRREITETVVGLIVASSVVAVVVLPTYFLAAHIKDVQEIGWGQATGQAIFLMVFTGFAILLSILILNLIHIIGEGVCSVLDAHGVHLRPKRRY